MTLSSGPNPDPDHDPDPHHDPDSGSDFPLRARALSLTPTLRLRLTPTLTPQVVNLNDASNVERLGVHALVTAHPQEEGLLLSGVLDFGDCYTSVPTRQLLSVRNISEHHLDVHLSSDLADEASNK